MGAVNWRHVAGAFLGAFAAWLVILAFLSLFAVLYGSSPVAPFQSSNTIGPFTGMQGTEVLIAIDFIIPLFAGLLFVLALAVLSRTNLTFLEFTSRGWALAAGALLGLTVFVLFYIPVLYLMSHPTPAQAVAPLALGIVDHLGFGATLGLVIYLVGGPVPFRGRPAPAEKAGEAPAADPPSR